MHDFAKDASKDSEKLPTGPSELTTRLAAQVGTVLKQKWRLDKLIGVGGMAAVYAATHRNGKRVAIKILHDDHARNMDVRGRFLREGYLANAVGHEGVVSIVDDDVTEDGAIFLVMELLEGETVERRWDRKGRRLPLGEVLWIANELLDILAAAHAKGVVHRDIKPENLFLARDGSDGQGVKLKVLDFGIARLRELSSRGSTTQGGTTMGTPAFMAPEQARGRWDEVDGRSDVWAVGGVMFALLAGRFVHVATTLNEQLLAAMTTAARPVASILPDLAPEIAEVIDRALAYKVEERWESARAMQDAIRQALTPSDARVASAIDPEKTAAMAPLDLAPTGTPTIDHGVASAPSAAPVRYSAPLRRSPYFVGLSAGALGVAIALVTLLHVPARMRAAAMPPATAPDEPAPVAAMAMANLAHPADGLPVHDAVDAGPAGWALHTQPAPPATGVPASIPDEPAPLIVHRLAAGPAAAPPGPADEAEPAPVTSGASGAASDAPATASEPANDTPATTEGLLDRRH